MAPAKDAFSMWSKQNFPFETIIEVQKVHTVLDVNAKNVFIIAKNLKFHLGVKLYRFIALKNGNNHHKKKVPINVNVEEL